MCVAPVFHPGPSVAMDQRVLTVLVRSHTFPGVSCIVDVEFDVGMSVKIRQRHLTSSDTVCSCFTFVYVLPLVCRLIIAAEAALAYVEVNVVLYVTLIVTLIVTSDTSVLSKQFLCMPKNLLHPVGTFANTSIFIRLVSIKAVYI